MTSGASANETGVSPGRGRPRVARVDAEEMLAEFMGDRVSLHDSVVVHRAPASCPACGATDVMWGCDPDQQRTKEEVHPLVWHTTEWMADSFICRSCWAGWIEPEDPTPITWVRPYWEERA